MQVKNKLEVALAFVVAAVNVAVVVKDKSNLLLTDKTSLKRGVKIKGSVD